KSYSVTWLEDQTVIGATAGNQTTASSNVTVNSFSRANGVLTLTSSATVNAIAGQVITPTFTFTNSGSTNDSLSIISANNLSGSGLTANTVYSAGGSALATGPATITA